MINTPLTTQEIEELEKQENIQPKGLTTQEIEELESQNISSFEEPTQTEAVLRGGLQGLSLGFGDELIGAGKAAYETAFGPEQLSNITETYRKERDIERAKMKAAEEAYPITFTGTEIGAGIVPALFTGGGSAAATLGRVGLKEAAKQGAKVGAKYGTVSGLGYGEADITKAELPEVIKETATGAAFGSVLGAGLGAIGQKTSEYGMEKLNKLRDWAKEKSTSSFRKMVEASKLAREGEELIGPMVEKKLLEDITSKAKDIQKNLKEVQTKGTKKIEDIWNKAEAEQMKKDYTSFIDNTIMEFQKEHQNALSQDTVNMTGKVLEHLNRIKNSFRTKEDVIVPDFKVKENAINALEKKKVLMELADAEGESASKEITKMLDKYSLVDGDIIPAKLDIQKVSKLAKINEQEASEILRDVAKLTYGEKKLIPKLGVEREIPKEIKSVIKEFKPGEIITDDLKGLAYFKDARGKVNSVYWGKIPTKIETREIQNAINLNPKEMLQFSKSLKELAGKDKGVIEKRVRDLATDVRKDLENLLNEKNILDEFTNTMKTYESMYGAAKSLRKKDLISDDKLKMENAIDDLSNMLQKVSMEDESGQKSLRKFEQFLKYYKNIVGEEKANELYTTVNKLSQLYDINQSAANSGLQVAKAFLGGVEALGIRGAIGIGKAEKAAENISEKTGNLIRNVVNVLPNNLAKLAEKTNNPKMKQLFNNLATTENDQSRRALLFSAMQNPSTRDLLLNTFGFKTEKEE